MLTADSFFELSGFAHRELLQTGRYVWDGLKKLKTYIDDCSYPDTIPAVHAGGGPVAANLVIFEDTIIDNREISVKFGDTTKGGLEVFRTGQWLEGASVIMAGAVLLGSKIKIGKGVLIEAGALIKSPAIIGDRTEVRQGAYMRGYCLIGAGCVVGHATEVKHSIFLDDAKAGHFAYLGDSIIGNQVNLGAGTKIANLRFTGGEVPVKTPDGTIDTGLRKLGAILGDHVQTGCNSVTNPGALLGKKSIILPNTTAPSGYHGNCSLIK